MLDRSFSFPKLDIAVLGIFLTLMLFPNALFLTGISIRRIYVLCILVYTLISRNFKISTTPYLKYVYFVYAYWIIYSLISSVWSKVPSEAYRMTGLIFFHFLIVFSITQIASIKNIKMIFLILMSIFIMYILISFWEMTTFNHLLSSRFTQLDKITYIPCGPFYNQNDFAFIMIMIFPFMLVLDNIFNNKLYWLISIVLSIAMLVIFTIQQSRFAIIIFIVEITYFIFRYTTRKKKIVLLFTIMTLVLVLVSIFPLYSNIAKEAVLSQITSIGNESESYIKESVDIRIDLIKSGFDMLYRSYFIGVGAGNYEEMMTSSQKFDTSYIVNAHNFFIEMIATTGLGMTLLFIILIMYSAYLAYTTLRTSGSNFIKYILIACLFTLLMFPLSSSMSSSINQLLSYSVILALVFSFINILVYE